MNKNISDIISEFFLHYYKKYDRDIKFIVGKNSTVAYGDGTYLMVIESEKGYDTVLDMFFLE